MMPYWPSLLGGMLIGLSASVLLLLNGRIAGVSGIVGRLLLARVSTNAAFVIGLLIGPLLFLAAFGHWPSVTITASLPVIAAAGLLVGFGSRMGSGCTSGHGICGMARLSKRSIVATAVFTLTGFVVVYMIRHVLS